MKSHLTIPIAVLVAALLCYLPLWERGTDAPGLEGETTRAVTLGANQVSTASSAHPTKLPRPEKSSRPTPAASHTPEQLKDFIIPSLAFEDASLPVALNALFDSYAEICAATGHSPVAFTYKLNGLPSGPINLKLSQTSFLSTLKLIALQSEMSLQREGSALTLSAIKDDPDAPLLTHSFPVPPNFLSTLQRTLDPDFLSGPDDPFAEPLPPPSMSALLDQLRVLQGRDQTSSYLPGTSMLVVKGTASENAKLKSLIEALSSPPHMIKTQIKIVAPSNDLELPVTNFTQSEFEQTMRRLSQQKGSDILTQPTIVTLPGQSGTIEVGRSVTREDPSAPGQFEDAWIGIRSEISSGGYGFDLRTTGALTESTLENQEDPSSIISRADVSYEGIQSKGMTTMLKTNAPDGSLRYAFITTTLIDATGTPINPEPAVSSFPTSPPTPLAHPTGAEALLPVPK